MSHEVTDEALMTRVREGTADDLAVLFERHHVPLFRFFFRLTADRAASEDLVQDVFYRILKYRHSYDGASAFRAWMYQIARHARADLLSARRDEVELSAAPALVLLPKDTTGDERARLLQRGLQQMSERQRELLVLSRYQGLKYDAIAEILGCTVGAVKVAVHRALRELREIVRKLEGGSRELPRDCRAHS